MQIIQETRTIIKAEDGKVLRKKTTGRVVGDTVHLGYDYYEAGILLKEPHLAKPDDYEEVDMITTDEGLQYPKDDQFKRLSRMLELVNQEKQDIQNQTFTTKEMLQIKDLYPCFYEDIKEGDSLKKGFKFRYKGELWVVLQDHVIMPYYFPNENTTSIYTKITEDYEEVGTITNPIDYNGGITLEEGKYYKQNEVIYLCTTNVIEPVYEDLKNLNSICIKISL